MLVWYCWSCLYHLGYRHFPDSLIDSSLEQSRNFFRLKILFLKIPTVCLLKKALFLLISIVEKGLAETKKVKSSGVFSLFSARTKLMASFFFRWGGRVSAGCSKRKLSPPSQSKIAPGNGTAKFNTSFYHFILIQGFMCSSTFGDIFCFCATFQCYKIYRSMTSKLVKHP